MFVFRLGVKFRTKVAVGVIMQMDVHHGPDTT